jgi:membrane dipeptidase
MTGQTEYTQDDVQRIAQAAVSLRAPAVLSEITDPSVFGMADAHCDTITEAMEKNQKLYDNNLHLDFARLKEFGAPIQVFSVWCADKYVPYAFDYTNEAIDFFLAEIAAHSDIIALAASSQDLAKNAKENKISAVLAIEGGEALEGKIENLEHFYNRGVRLITLTWNRENALGYGMNTGSNQGLKPFGKQCVQRMNELGVIIDVSHLNEAGFWDV